MTFPQHTDRALSVQAHMKDNTTGPFLTYAAVSRHERSDRALRSLKYHLSKLHGTLSSTRLPVSCIKQRGLLQNVVHTRRAPIANLSTNKIQLYMFYISTLI